LVDQLYYLLLLPAFIKRSTMWRTVCMVIYNPRLS